MLTSIIPANQSVYKSNDEWQWVRTLEKNTNRFLKISISISKTRSRHFQLTSFRRNRSSWNGHSVTDCPLSVYCCYEKCGFTVQLVYCRFIVMICDTGFMRGTGIYKHFLRVTVIEDLILPVFCANLLDNGYSLSLYVCILCFVGHL